MVEAAKNPNLEEAFQKHLIHTQGQVERLQKVFELLGEQA
jgi:ferritin-like metal-binding protein YciE